jgi:hypothetical protein
MFVRTPFYNMDLRKYMMDSINKSIEKYSNNNTNNNNNNSNSKYIRQLTDFRKSWVYGLIASGLLGFTLGYKLGSKR